MAFFLLISFLFAVVIVSFETGTDWPELIYHIAEAAGLELLILLPVIPTCRKFAPLSSPAYLASS